MSNDISWIMPAGLPNSVDILADVVPILPNKFVAVLKYIYSKYARMYIYTKTWYKYGRKYDAPLRPFYLYSVNPDNINKTLNKKIGSTWECSIRSGQWDQTFSPINEDPTYKSFVQRFKIGMDWKSTELYSRTKKLIDDGECVKSCESCDEYLKRLHEYDKLYDSIRKNGYKTQQEIRNLNDTGRILQNKQFHPPEFNEITVDIGRNGELFWYSGIHRLVIAKLLELDSVPVRIRVRHKIWQKQRDVVWNNTKNCFSHHPDLRY